MKSIYDYKSAKKFLKDELQTRVARNPKYSMRAFARDLNYSSSRLSQFLNSSRGISVKSAQNIAKALKFSPDEVDFFINLLMSEFGKSKYLRDVAKERIAASLVKFESYATYSKDIVDKLVSEWYLMPLSDLLTHKENLSVHRISKLLKINKKLVEQGIEILLKYQVIRHTSDGRFERDKNLYKVISPDHGSAIRSLLKLNILRALDEIDRQKPENRRYLTSYVTLKKSQLDEAREELEKFCLKFVKKYNNVESSCSMYTLNIQFYECTQANE